MTFSFGTNLSFKKIEKTYKIYFYKYSNKNGCRKLKMIRIMINNFEQIQSGISV